MTKEQQPDLPGFERPERPERPERSEEPERPEGPERPERPERTEGPPERPVGPPPESGLLTVLRFAAMASGPPVYLPWNYSRRKRPPSGELQDLLETLKSRWMEVVGPHLADMTCPVAFSGARARRLIVRADPKRPPPWGSWSQLSNRESARRTFTEFRRSINQVLQPHEVDHVAFTTADWIE